MQLALALCLLIGATWAQSDNDCPGGYRNGQEVIKDPYWYRCEYGDLRPQGCLDDTDRKVGIQQTFRVRDYEYTCKLDSRGYLELVMTGCVHKDRTVRAGEEVDLGTYYFKCHDRGHFVRGEVMGCLDNGRRIGLNERVRKNDMHYECQLASGGVAKLQVLGCVHMGREWTIGQQYTDEKYVYSCNMDGRNKCKVQTLGCVHAGRKLYDQQTYHADKQIWRCFVKGDRTGAEHRVQGCVISDPFNPSIDVEKSFGCQWEDGQPPYRYLVECIEKDGKAIPARFRCMYSGPEGYIDVLPGCYGQLGSTYIGCKKGDVEGDVRIEVFHDKSRADYFGLTNDPYYCNIFTGLNLKH